MTPISLPFRRRNAAVAGGVLLAHAAALWALQHGLLRQQPPEIVVPVQVLSEIIPAQPAEPAAPPPAPAPAPPPPAPPAPVPPKPAPAPAPRKAPAPRPAPNPPAPMPAAIPDPAPAPAAPLGTTAPQPPAPPIAAPVAPPAPASIPGPPAPPAPGPVNLPMVDADYAANEEAFRPPAISRRLGEYGTVLLRVTVGVNGLATRVELVRSSGYDRLDKAALAGARQLKFRPATRNGVPVEWTYDFPVRYAERTR